MENDALYTLYFDLLFYEFCLETMQTVTFVEKIFSDFMNLYCLFNSSLWGKFSSEFKSRNYIIATKCIENMFNIVIPDLTQTNTYNWDFNNIALFLKENARSKQVKNYFGL